MKPAKKNKILTTSAFEKSLGRENEVSEILRRIKEPENGRGLLILSSPADGSSEILHRVFDEIFNEQGAIIPIYFSFSREDKTCANAARRFLQTFLTQTVAFRRNNARLLDASPEICEVAELAVPVDGHWVDRLTNACVNESVLKDERSFIRSCFSAPLRAAASGALNVVILDDIHLAQDLEGEVSLVSELRQIYSRSTVPFVFAGRRRFVLSAMQSGEAGLTNVDLLKINALTPDEAFNFIEKTADALGVKTNEQTRNLIFRQIGGKPLLLQNFLLAAKDKNIPLESYSQVQQVYIEELLGGRIGRFFDAFLAEIGGNQETQKEILHLLYETQKTPEGKSSLEFWRKRINLNPESFYEVLRRLNLQETICLTSGIIEIAEDETIIRDYLTARFRTEIKNEPRGLILAQMLAESLKRAPNLVAKHFRESSALGLRALLGAFNSNEVPRILFDYGAFKQKLKGESEENIKRFLAAETEKIKLPQIVFTTNCASVYPPIRQFTEDERCSVALGFEAAHYTPENEIVWLVAEIDAKLEAEKELTEFWLDRLEMVAVFCNFNNYRIWLITPEGFSAEADETLKSRGAFGASRAQVALLANQLKHDIALPETKAETEFEFVVPMSGDAEMITAKMVESIARRANFSAKDINQIKTALAEACINASEHSHSPDGKIYQKFALNGDKMTITVANRGVMFRRKDQISANNTASLDLTSRRGWGLGIIRKLMDEVYFEQTDEGTRLKMVKYLSKSGSQKD